MVAVKEEKGGGVEDKARKKRVGKKPLQGEGSLVKEKKGSGKPSKGAGKKGTGVSSVGKRAKPDATPAVEESALVATAEAENPSLVTPEPPEPPELPEPTDMESTGESVVSSVIVDKQARNSVSETDIEEVEIVGAGVVEGLNSQQLASMNQLNLDPEQTKQRNLNQITKLLREKGIEAREKAVILAQKLEKQFPEDPFVRIALAYAKWSKEGAAAGRAELEILFTQHADHAEGFHLLGMIEMAERHYEEACRALDRAWQLKPEMPAICVNYASVLIERRQFDEAERVLGKIEQAKGMDNQIRIMLVRQRSSIAEGKGDIAQALARIRHALRIWPNDRLLWERLYSLAIDSRNSWEAFMAANVLAAVVPDERIRYLGLAATVLREFDQYPATLAMGMALAREVPGMAEAWAAIAFGRVGVGAVDQHALAAIENACKIAKDPATRRQRAWIQFSLGNLEEGFRDYEARLETANLVPRPDPERLRGRDWDGAPLQGRTLLVWREQGMGDQIHFARYLRHLRRYIDDTGGGRIFLLIEGPLYRLFHQFPVDGLYISIDKVPDFDVACPLTSLPVRMPGPIRTYAEDIPYLRAPEGLEAPLWGSIEPDLMGGRLRIGLAWAGNPANPRDHRRSMRLEWFAGLLAREDVVVYDLQIRHHRQNVGSFAGLRQRKSEPRDLVDTAASLRQLDLVITVDSVLAHLCGAMGRKDWVMLPAIGDWRWGQGTAAAGKSDIWYPNLHMIRQTLPGEWGSVIVDLDKRLNAYIAARR